MKPTKPANPQKVTPEAGWELHSSYGALQDSGRRPLERLEAVHAFLMERDGLASSDAAAMVFGPFLSDANSKLGMEYGADKLRPYLMICDPADRAYSLFPAGKYADRSHLELLAGIVPYVQHHRFDPGTPEGLLYALAQMAGEVWAPYSGDFDLNDRPVSGLADGDFPSVVKAREILGPFAVRHDLAHKLWGWGTVAEVVQLHAVVAEDAKPATWAALILYRTKNKGHAWTQEMRALLVEEEAKRKAAGGTGIRKKMAGELGSMTPSGLGDQIRKAATGTKSGRGRKAA